MPYVFDYAVATSYGAAYNAREESGGGGTVGRFQLVGHFWLQGRLETSLFHLFAV